MVRLYVEGGGQKNKALDTKCRRGFAEFLEKAGFRGRMPRITSCGSRRNAFDSFKSALGNTGGYPMLLVDSEGPVIGTDSWAHVRQRDGDNWVQPNGATADQLHFMVQTMEAWFFADKGAVEAYFGRGFRKQAMSGRANVEEIPKHDLVPQLEAASQDCQKGAYSKGVHSFEVLGTIDPTKVIEGSGWARRFVDSLLRTTEEV